MLRIGLPLFVAIVSLGELTVFKVNDDTSLFQALPSVILSQEAIISLTGANSEQKWFIIYGDDAEKTFKRLETFIMKLNIVKKCSWLTNYHLIPFNSKQNQYHDMAFLRAPILEKSQSGHYPSVVLDKLKMAAKPGQIKQCVENSVNESWRLIWTSLADGRNGILVPVDGVSNSTALSALAEALRYHI